MSVDPGPISGCTVFPALGSGAEYLLVPQAATGTPGDSSSFLLGGASLALAGVAPQQVAPGAPIRLSPADQFHSFLRQAERDRSYGRVAEAPPGPEAQFVPQAMTTITPIVPGSVDTFKVCGDLDCRTLPSVIATAMKVGQHIAIFVDNAAPAGGLTQADLDTLQTIFDTKLYGVDTLAFGRESDIDANGVVIVLMTGKVNSLVTAAQCSDPNGGFVAGYFFGADIDPTFRTQFNNGEIFYSIVADPSATLSCSHTAPQVKRLVPITFAHEFQHMISFNQHVLLRNGQSETLWLNEGLSHYAEERAGKTFPLGDITRSNFSIGDWYNAFQYLGATGSHFLLPNSGIGTIAERGAAWLFVRYLVDQFRADTSQAASDTVTRKLVQTSLTGATNVGTQKTGTPFTTHVTRWALANYVSDLPGFTAPSELKYTSYNLRTLYDSLHTVQPGFFPSPQFPLQPVSGQGSLTNLSGFLRAGSGVYSRALQSAGANGFALLFSDGAGRALRASLVPRLNVIRIQ